MGFPSPATDYQENRLSLDQHCNTGAPEYSFFRSDTYSFREGIKPGALLIVDFGGTPLTGLWCSVSWNKNSGSCDCDYTPSGVSRNSISWITSGLYLMTMRTGWRSGGSLRTLWHCCKVSDEAAFCLIQRPYISKTLLTRRISPRGSP